LSLRFLNWNSSQPDDCARRAIIQQQNQPTFVTINEKDFWRKVAINARFCVVCFALPDSRVYEIPTRLRSLFHHSVFETKEERMGKVIRVADEGISYYAFKERSVRMIGF
jgi:hypothetical protein